MAFFLSFFLCREVKGILKRVQNDGEFAKGLYFHLTRLVTLNSFQGLMVITWSRNVINYMFYSVLFSRGVSRQSRVAQDILKSVFCLIKKGRKKSRLQFLSSKTCIKGKFSGRAPPSLCYERVSSFRGVRELVTLLLGSQFIEPFILFFGVRNRRSLSWAQELQ